MTKVTRVKQLGLTGISVLFESCIRPVLFNLLSSNMIKSMDYRHRGHRATYQEDKPKVT